MNITDVNEAPVIAGVAAMDIDENAQTGTDVGDALTATDEDGGHGHLQCEGERHAVRG